jgi:hypothetical protein
MRNPYVLSAITVVLGGVALAGCSTSDTGIDQTFTSSIAQPSAQGTGPEPASDLVTNDRTGYVTRRSPVESR